MRLWQRHLYRSEFNGCDEISSAMVAKGVRRSVSSRRSAFLAAAIFRCFSQNNDQSFGLNNGRSRSSLQAPVGLRCISVYITCLNGSDVNIRLLSKR